MPKPTLFTWVFYFSKVLFQQDFELLAKHRLGRYVLKNNRYWHGKINTMSLKRFSLLAVTHLVTFIVGFGAGIYLLPILIAPPAPTDAEVQQVSVAPEFTAQFVRELEGSDALHWGEGTVSLGRGYASLVGSLAPGPDYRLYLSPEFVETEQQFLKARPQMQHIGDVRTFTNFLISTDPDIDLTQYNTVIVWCETFGEFITAAKYR